MRLRAGPTICACGWSGVLGAKSPCPACARPAIDRMDEARIAALREVRARQDAPLNRTLRACLMRIGSLRALGSRPPVGTEGRIYRGMKNRSHVVTPLGLAALATADRLDCERVAAAIKAMPSVGQQLIDFLDGVPMGIANLPSAPDATAAVIDAMLAPYTRRTL